MNDPTNTIHPTRTWNGERRNGARDYGASDAARQIGDHVREHGDGRDIVGELLRIDLVERVGFAVVVVEVRAVVDVEPDLGHAGVGHRLDVGAAVAVADVRRVQRREQRRDVGDARTRALARFGVLVARSSRKRAA